MRALLTTLACLLTAAGVRFLAIPERGINVGFDAAVGRGDWGIYFRITEAF